MPNWKKIALSGSSPEFSSLIVDNSVSAGSISGSFSGSFQGDGSSLTGIDVGEVTLKTDNFTSVTSKQVTHTFGTKDVNVTVYDSNDKLIIPASVTTTDTNTVDITFDTATTGRVVITKGGHIVTGSIQIASSSTVSDSFTAQTSYTASHTFGTTDVFVQVYDNTDSLIIPQKIKILTTGSIGLDFDTATTGKVIIGKSGHIVSGSAEVSTVSYDNVTSKPTLISSSAQIATDISGSFTATSASIASDIANISTDFADITNKPTLLSGSAQIASDISGSFTSTSSSLASRLSTAESELSNTLISSSGNLVSGELVYSTGGTSVSSSNLVYLDTANERVGIKTTSPQYPFHYVQDTGNALAVYEKTGGAAIFYEAQDTRGALGTVATHPLLFAINSAEVSRINTSGVYEGDLSGSLTGTASYATTASFILGSNVSGAVPSASFASTAGSSTSSSFATTSSFASTGPFLSNTGGTVDGDLTLTGTLTAQTYIVSSSVTYMTQSFSSGSTIFGDSLDDTHLFTGSLNVTGSANLVASQSLNTRDSSSLSFWAGSQAQYDALGSYNSNTIYYVT